MKTPDAHALPPTDSSPRDGDASILAPLRRPLFCALWAAGAVSSMGTWIQNVGATWLIADSSASSAVVSLIQAAMSLPVVFLALPAGALADIVDRRRLLIGAQAWMLVVAALLTALTFLGLATPSVLLVATFLLGIGAALNAPAWQAIVPELVPRSEVPAAIALNSASMNLGRAVGPALGGLLVALSGAGAAFLINALSFVGLLVVLVQWQRPHEQSVLPAERLSGAMRAGMRFVSHSPSFRSILLRTAVFSIGGSGLWALLPVVTRTIEGTGPGTYGVLLACLGLGAVVGLTLLHFATRQLGPGALVVLGSIAFALSTLVLAWVPVIALWCVVLLPAGSAWLVVLTRLSSSAQAVAPRWVRARAMSVYLLFFFGGMATGSVLWGMLADQIGTHGALTAAAAWTAIGSILVASFPLPTVAVDHEPIKAWREPEALPAVMSRDTPCVVTVEYQIDPDRADEFLQAILPMQEARLRSGAIHWDVFRDTADAGRFFEVFVDDSWIEHLRHHQRVSQADRDLQLRLRTFQRDGEPPKVTHLVAASR